MDDVVYLVPQLSIQKEEAKKKEVHIEENVPAPTPRSNCSVLFFPSSHLFAFPDKFFVVLFWFMKFCFNRKT